MRNLKDQLTVIDALIKALDSLKTARRCDAKVYRVATMLEKECEALAEEEVEDDVQS